MPEVHYDMLVWHRDVAGTDLVERMPEWETPASRAWGGFSRLAIVGRSRLSRGDSARLKRSRFRRCSLLRADANHLSRSLESGSLPLWCALDSIWFGNVEMPEVHSDMLVQHLYGFTRHLPTAEGGRTLADLPDCRRCQTFADMEERGLVSSKWGMTANNRKARYYEITARGRAHLKAETAKLADYTATLSAILGAKSV